LDWNDASTAFTGLKLNVTNTASLAGSKLLDLQVGGTSKFEVGAIGTSSTSFVFASGVSTAWTPATGAWAFGSTGSAPPSLVTEGSLGAGLTSSGKFWWGNTSTGLYSTRDVVLARDDAGILAQRNGTAAQTFRLYNTWGNNGVDFERTSLTRDSSGLVIDAQKGGTGADPTNLLDVKLDGTSRFKFNSNGSLTFGSSSTFYSVLDGANGNPVLYGGSNGATFIFQTGNYGVFSFASDIALGWNSTTAFNSTRDLALARDSAGVVKITDGSTGTGYVKQTPVLVSALPAAATVGAGTRGFVSDATATTFASVVTGSGTASTAGTVPVYSDGTDWRIG